MFWEDRAYTSAGGGSRNITRVYEDYYTRMYSSSVMTTAQISVTCSRTQKEKTKNLQLNCLSIYNYKVEIKFIHKKFDNFWVFEFKFYGNNVCD